MVKKTRRSRRLGEGIPPGSVRERQKAVRKKKAEDKIKANLAKKKRKAATPKANVGAAAELHVYKDPFSTKTAQPRIPDGRVYRSLGISNQTAGEIVCNQSGSKPAGALTGLPETGIMHIMMYSGLNSGAVVWGSQGGVINASETPYTAYECAFEHMTFDGVPEIAAIGTPTPSGATLAISGGYASWRQVSEGLKLSLLNPSEFDDGWFEMIRLKEPLDTSNWEMSNRKRESDFASLTCHPGSELYRDPGFGLFNRVLSNDPSFKTGLLRDIHKHTFKLAPTYKDHEFKTMMDSYVFPDNQVGTVASIGPDRFISFNDGQDDVKGFIENVTDPSFDLVYIRIHGRPGTTNPTRLHYNLVSNQEVTFAPGERESRFMKPSYLAQAKADAARNAAMKEEENL